MFANCFDIEMQELSFSGLNDFWETGSSICETFSPVSVHFPVFLLTYRRVFVGPRHVAVGASGSTAVTVTWGRSNPGSW